MVLLFIRWWKSICKLNFDLSKSIKTTQTNFLGVDIVIDIVLDEARVQKFFKSDVEFVEDLTDEVKAYRQNDGKIAVVIDLIHKDVTEETLQFFQIVAESYYFKYDEVPVNIYVITLGCRVLAKEHTIPSIAKFTIKLCCRDYSVL